MIRMVDTCVRPLHEDDIEAVVRLALAAWAPVFRSFEEVLGPDAFGLMYPDWRKSQAEAVEQVCRDPERMVWVAEVDGMAAGFVACSFNAGTKIGEVYMLAVDPVQQRRGIGTTLNAFALERMREAGMALVEVSTGGDPGHAPARRAYEKVGYSPFPLVLYYKVLQS